MTRSARWLALIETLKIRARDRRIIALRYNYPQQRLWDICAPKIDRLEPIRVIVLKFRRGGVSTGVESMLTAFCLSGDGVQALVTAHMKKPAGEIWGMSKRFVTTSPLLSAVATIGNQAITFGRSTLKIATAGSPESERGGDLTAAHFSEGAFYPHPGFLTAAMQALPHTKKIFSIGIIESTANGMEGVGEDFYNEWQRAEDGDSEWIPLFLGTHEFPDYQIEGAILEPPFTPEEYALRERFEVTDAHLAWRRWCIANNCKGDVSLYHQEYPYCLIGETRISTEEGIIPLSEASGKIKTESAQIIGLYPQGSAPVFRVKTQAGRELIGTADHPLQRPDGCFVDLAESVGESVSLRPPQFSSYEAKVEWETFGGVRTTLTVDERWGRFLGYFMGDGCYHNGTVSIACDAKDQDVVEDVRSLLTHIIGKPSERLSGEKKGCHELRVGSAEFASLMKRIGIWHPDKPHRRVCVPDVIWRSPKSVVREFLRGLFEADGFNGYRCNRVTLFSKWPVFLRDVQLLLLGFGIPCHISERPATTGGHNYTARTIWLRSSEAMLFNREIGFVGARKRGRGIPHRGGKKGARPRLMPMEDKVVSVEPAGEAQVFDLSLRDRHTFSANGLVVHNTAEEAFIQSGLPFFSTDQLLPMEKYLRKGTRGTVDADGKFTRRDDGPVEMFVAPERGHQYVIGADSAMGIPDMEGKKQHSRSAGVVLDMETLEQVAEYDAASPPHLFARDLVGMGRLYHNALLAPEINASGGGGGREVLVFIRSYGYWNIHHWKHDADRIRRSDPIVLGWETSSKTRPRMLARLRETVMEKSSVIHSRRLYKQLAAFGESDSGHTEALSGRDDLLFAYGIALVSRSENYYKAVAQPRYDDGGQVNWDSLGIHVKHPEDLQTRLKRLLATPGMDDTPPEFMAL